MSESKKMRNLLLSILLALAIGFIFVFIMGVNPFGALLTFLTASFNSSVSITSLISRALPYIVMALGISVAFRAELFNIGGPGQMIWGAFAGVLIGAYLHLPSPLLILLVFAGASLLGALWAVIPTIFKAKFNTNLVVSTLMMNYIAIYFVQYLIRDPMRDPASTISKSLPLLPEATLPTLSTELPINAGIFIVIFLVLIAYLLLEKSAFGFSVREIGGNISAAEASGINLFKTQIVIMAISGAFFGSRWGVMVNGIFICFDPWLSNLYGL